MPSDKNILVAFITALEKISQKIENELSNLKKKIKYSEIIPGIKDYHLKFLIKVLEPIFVTNEIIKFEDIRNYVKDNKLDYEPTTIRCYISALHKGKKIEIIPKGRETRYKLLI